MTLPMHGVRILEVAEHTFVPAASALLAEWGAEVIKVEHHERGDAMRGLASSGTVSIGDGAHVLLEHSNRGKKSIGIDLTTEAGLNVLYRLAAVSDVFLTNKLPEVRAKLRIDVDEIRGRNPDIIYVRGSGQGARGPEAGKGSYDSLAYWARAGIAAGQMPVGSEEVPPPPAPAFGDSIGGMTIAGGIMGALFHRERTGEATVVDVSLLGVGMWSMAAAIALSLQSGTAWRGRPPGTAIRNPLTGYYLTSDGRAIALTCLQAAKYWPEMCRVLNRPDLAADERFADTASITANAPAAAEILAEIFATRTYDEWIEVLGDFAGQWAPVQDALQVADDPQAVANEYVRAYTDVAGAPYRLVSPPVHYDGSAPSPRRAPGFNEHGDEILRDLLGLDDEAIIDLKIQSAVT